MYLSAVHNLQIALGLSDPFTGVAMPQVMQGIKKVQAESMSNKGEHLPIFPTILFEVKGGVVR